MKTKSGIPIAPIAFVTLSALALIITITASLVMHRKPSSTVVIQLDPSPRSGNSVIIKIPPRAAPAPQPTAVAAATTPSQTPAATTSAPAVALAANPPRAAVAVKPIRNAARKVAAPRRAALPRHAAAPRVAVDTSGMFANLPAPVAAAGGMTTPEHKAIVQSNDLPIPRVSKEPAGAPAVVSPGSADSEAAREALRSVRPR